MGRDQRGQIVIIAFTFSLVGMPGRGFAVMNETTECLVDFEGVSDTYKSGGTLQCTDCDPSCDADGLKTKNQSCTFNLKVCVNEAVTPTAHAAAPFGGCKASGYGRTHGVLGLREFATPRVFFDHRPGGFRPQLFPYASSGPVHDRIERNDRAQRRPSQPGVFRTSTNPVSLIQEWHHFINQKIWIALPLRPQLWRIQ